MISRIITLEATFCLLFLNQSQVLLLFYVLRVFKYQFILRLIVKCVIIYIAYVYGNLIYENGVSLLLIGYTMRSEGIIVFVGIIERLTNPFVCCFHSIRKCWETNLKLLNGNYKFSDLSRSDGVNRLSLWFIVFAIFVFPFIAIYFIWQYPMFDKISFGKDYVIDDYRKLILKLKMMIVWKKEHNA